MPDAAPDAHHLLPPSPRYTTISEQVYTILMRHTRLVQPLSCDEAYLDVSGAGDPEVIASAIRAEIQQVGGTCASMLLLAARLCLPAD